MRAAERMPGGELYERERLVGVAGEFGGNAAAGAGVVADAALKGGLVLSC